MSFAVCGEACNPADHCVHQSFLPFTALARTMPVFTRQPRVGTQFKNEQTEIYLWNFFHLYEYEWTLERNTRTDFSLNGMRKGVTSRTFQCREHNQSLTDITIHELLSVGCSAFTTIHKPVSVGPSPIITIHKLVSVGCSAFITIHKDCFGRVSRIQKTVASPLWFNNGDLYFLSRGTSRIRPLPQDVSSWSAEYSI